MFKEVTKFNGSNSSHKWKWIFPCSFFIFFSRVWIVCYNYIHFFIVINTTSQHFQVLYFVSIFYSFFYSPKYQSKPFPYVPLEWASVFITTSWPVICPTGCCKRGIQAVCRWSNFGKTLCSTLQVSIIMLFFNQPRFRLSDPIHSSQP